MDMGQGKSGEQMAMYAKAVESFLGKGSVLLFGMSTVGATASAVTAISPPQDDAQAMVLADAYGELGVLLVATMVKNGVSCGHPKCLALDLVLAVADKILKANGLGPTLIDQPTTKPH